MTLSEALCRADEVCPNGFSRAEKTAWISQLEWTLRRTLYDTHEGPEFRFHGLTAASDGRTPLWAPEPYSELYVLYLTAMIDYYNRETAAYNNAMLLFNSLLTEFSRWYRRTHKPKSGRIGYFGNGPQTAADS